MVTSAVVVGAGPIADAIISEFEARKITVSRLPVAIDPREADALWAEVRDRPASLVYCAPNRDAAPFVGMSFEYWRRSIDEVLSGAFLAAQRATRRWRTEDAAGSIVLVGSVLGLRSPEAPAAAADQSAAHAGLANMAVHFGVDLAPSGGRANAVLVGEIWSPSGRISNDAVSAAKTAVHLALDADDVSGQVVVVDGAGSGRM